jgi:hypothetical protein
MSNKTLAQGEGLAVTDKTLYVDLGSGVFALVAASVLVADSALVGSGNPIPVEVVTPILLTAVKTVSLPDAQALNSLGICHWINDKVPGSSQVVLTDGPAGDQPGVYYNLLEGDTVVITQLCIELITSSDEVIYELGYTDAANGAGTFQPITPKRVYSTGASNLGFEGVEFRVVPPEPITYASGARSITFRVNCNDAAAKITPAWHGYILR